MRSAPLALPLLFACGGGSSPPPPPADGEIVGYFMQAGAPVFVADPSGAPPGATAIAGATIGVEILVGFQPVGTTGALTPALTVTSQADGSFRIGGVPRGLLELQGHRTAPVSPVVQPDASVLITFTGGSFRVGARYPIDRAAALARVAPNIPATALVHETHNPLPAGTKLDGRAAQIPDESGAPAFGTPDPYVLGAPSWLIVADDDYLALDLHPRTYFLVDADTGEVLAADGYFGEPTVDGDVLWRATERNGQVPADPETRDLPWPEDVVQVGELGEEQRLAEEDASSPPPGRLTGEGPATPQDIVAVIIDGASQEGRVSTTPSAMAFQDFLRRANVPMTNIFPLDTQLSDLDAAPPELPFARANNRIAERLESEGRRSTLVIYVAGHAAIGSLKKLRLCFGDKCSLLDPDYRGVVLGYRDDPGREGVEESELQPNRVYARIKQSQACRAIFVIESCFSTRFIEKMEEEYGKDPAPLELKMFAASGRNHTAKGRYLGGIYIYTQKFLSLATVTGADITISNAFLEYLEDGGLNPFSVANRNGGPTHRFLPGLDANMNGTPDNCDDEMPPDTVGFDVTTSQINFRHDSFKTLQRGLPCPRELTQTINVQNNDEETLSVTVTTGTTSVSIDPPSFTLEPGETKSLKVLIDCAVRESFQTTIELRALTPSGEMVTKTVMFSYDRDYDFVDGAFEVEFEDLAFTFNPMSTAGCGSVLRTVRVENLDRQAMRFTVTTASPELLIQPSAFTVPSFQVGAFDIVRTCATMSSFSAIIDITGLDLESGGGSTKQLTVQGTAQ